jgi:hypothetical protein
MLEFLAALAIAALFGVLWGLTVLVVAYWIVEGYKR